LSSVLSSFISSLLEFLVLIVLLLAFGVNISLNILFFPVIQIVYFIMVYGISLALAALYVYYKDLNQIWEVLLQLGFFISPVCYSISTVPEKYIFYYMLNPVTLVMQIYRKTLLYAESPSAVSLVYILLSACVLLILGTVIFKRLERRFAEEL
jgi:lipopolysaccharide transport system permease protein